MKVNTVKLLLIFGVCRGVKGWILTLPVHIFYHLLLLGSSKP